ncbi:MAG: DinB family protein [candidate division Zixibacteria bacterium]|nr:DinB family protein [candidate division Zixibacteria bacterium]
MSDKITNEQFTKQILASVREAFEKPDGVFLDRGTSLFETLAGISCEQASRPLLDGGTTIAGHVFHTCFYLQVTIDYLEDRLNRKIDWKDSWIISTRNNSEWSELRGQLEREYATVIAYLSGVTDWTDLRILGALGILAHTAYHLGAIRQMATLVARES